MKNKRGKKNHTMKKPCIFIAHKLFIYNLHLDNNCLQYQ